VVKRLDALDTTSEKSKSLFAVQF